jgi:chemotaxis protein methyltransferase CheR
LEVEEFRQLLSERFGFQLDDTKLGQLGDVLGERLRTLGLGASSYLHRIRDDAAELRELASRLTVSETFFFRYAGHFRAFAEIVLPDRLAACRATRRLRILSAGCASGEEAYTLAMVLLESVPDLESWQIELRGFDINPRVLARATEGKYSTWSLRETSADHQRRYFESTGGTLTIDGSVRSMVSFEERNLVHDDPLFWRPGAFDVVFCRNVLMYLTPEKMRQVVARIERSLSPGGFLFLGHAETLRGLSQQFHLCHSHDAFYYRLRDGAEATAPFPHEPSTLPPSLPERIGVSLGLPDSSWIDVIQGASDRVAALSVGGPSSRAATAEGPLSPTLPAWDRGPALEMVRQERFAEALDLLRAAPAHSASDPETRLLRAVLLTNSGRLPQAEQACQDILADDELSSGAHYLLALCRDHAGDRLAAIDHDQTAAYLEPGFAMPHLHLGLLARRAGELDTARAELHHALLLIGTEDASRILLYGGGFNREGLRSLCKGELSMCGDGA